MPSKLSDIPPLCTLKRCNCVAGKVLSAVPSSSGLPPTVLSVRGSFSWRLMSASFHVKERDGNIFRKQASRQRSQLRCALSSYERSSHTSTRTSVMLLRWE
uniref:Uncharacterized protein n=1 Tax=Chrysotila carterae TaxID=13221 RepID=A0A6S9VDC3_CHRCT